MKPHISIEQFLKILDRFLNGTATPKENSSVVNWIESVDEEKNFDLSKSDQNEVGARIWASINQKKEEKKRSSIAFFPSWISTGIAASLILLVSIVIYLQVRPKEKPQQTSSVNLGSFSLSANVVVAEAMEKEVVLPDGSVILLKPNSRISYNDVLHEEQRTVTLIGEAFFTISHNKEKPFVVYADHIRTTVLGTSFSIKAPGDGKEISVSVSTGTVSVSSLMEGMRSSGSTRREVILTPNEEAVFNPARREITANLVSVPKPIVEISKTRVVFDDEPVALILESIALSYGVEINYDKAILAKCKMTTAFSTEGLYERLNIVSKITGVSYTIDGTRIVFESKVCN